LLVAMARARRGVMLRQFTERRGGNLRAAYRDIETLREAEIPVEHDEHGWYRVPEHWIPVGTVDVKPDEVHALSIARYLAPALRETAIGRALDRLWSKLVTPTRQPGLPLGDEASFRTLAGAAIDLAPHRATVATVHEASRAQRALCIRYRKVRGDERERETERVIEPSFLFWYPQSETLYVRAYCRLRSDFRTFAIHRILSAELLDDPFARRPDPAWEGGRGFRLWHRPTSERVSVRFSPEVAGEIYELRLHASQQLTDAPDGGVVLELDVSDPEEMERWLLGFGPDAQVLAPASLAERIRRRHAEAAGLRVGTIRARPACSSPAAAAAQPELALRRRGSGEH
jgi:predicted DNA-binding transcriptional regulator YafY